MIHSSFLRSLSKVCFFFSYVLDEEVADGPRAPDLHLAELLEAADRLLVVRVDQAGLAHLAHEALDDGREDLGEGRPVGVGVDDEVVEEAGGQGEVEGVAGEGGVGDGLVGRGERVEVELVLQDERAELEDLLAGVG